MDLKRNPLKIFTAFIAAVIAAIFGSGSSKALSVETKTLLEPTIEERIVNVREQLRIQKTQIIGESDTLVSPLSSPKPSPTWKNWSDANDQKPPKKNN